MSQFGIIGGESQYGGAATSFGGAVTSVAKSLEAKGTAPNKQLGEVTLRTESRKSHEGSALLAGTVASAQQLAQSIVDTLSFEEDPKTPSVGLNVRTESNKARAMQAAMLELVQSFNVGEMIDEVLKGVNLSSLIESDVAE